MKIPDIENQLNLMLQLSLQPDNCAGVLAAMSEWDSQQLAGFVRLAGTHHMILRALGPLAEMAAAAGLPHLQRTAQEAIVTERERIRVSLKCLDALCGELESMGCPVVLFKTLDHWPDFGSDLDLCTIGDERFILEFVQNKFHARKRWRSFGDRLSHKWSFELHGDPTEVEIHINRLGQAGEHIELAERLIARRRPMLVNGYSVFVPAPEERVITAVSQRLYRNLYFRICDFVNLFALIQSRELCWEELRSVANSCGVWPGVAAYLTVVSEYLEPYLGNPLALPADVEATAESLSLQKLFVKNSVLHLPMVPDGMRLFMRRFAHTLRNRDFAAMARLSLLPPLASLGVLAYAVTGNSGRIW